MTAELPGVDEKDIKVSLDNNQLVISGEKKAESTKEEKKTGMSRRGATAHSTDRCPYHSSRRTELSMLISTRACCASRSRSPLRP